MPDDPQTEQSIFLAAIEKPDEAERAAFLDQACGDNAELRAEVEALIQAHETSGECHELCRCDLSGVGDPGLEFGSIPCLD